MRYASNIWPGQLFKWQDINREEDYMSAFLYRVDR